MASVFGICTIVVITAIDNALLAGVLIPHMQRGQKKIAVTVVAVLLAVSQVVFSASVDYFMQHVIFRVVAIVVLAWMSVRVLYVGMRSSDRLFASILRLFFVTLVGNLDNIIWLGSTLHGDRLWLTLSSFISIPIFIFITLFLSDQIEKQVWILPLGAGMMAWAASTLMFDLPVMKRFIAGLDDAPFMTFQCLMTAMILAIGLCVRKFLSQKNASK
ncbi:hypothetical protein NZD89_10905 [Alicyclobacillus fastidiosus]|uniref:Uncharacterized protein n=1 Tax=Alicyclobacillus fastidiosus TaxID=392011 RepID=A0ABY6ZLQ9_9BACL|nr:hypothetical protein [Alicyclobacillus fastidiosus]WAH43843.1 hypothetical protein NZD89_10905 [Alicyclobacillus fastidiosus]GMA60078.1 hypothetical protein GCM10025859_05180 [Alicyclobacillus fastidiosus]